MLLEKCDRKRNTIYDLEKKSVFPACDKIARTADYLDCSVDYLLGRTDNSEVNRSVGEGKLRTLKMTECGGDTRVFTVTDAELEEIKKQIDALEEVL